MDAIKSYLEAMFANLPNTEAVRKAKKELAQMMEDKYNELIAGGSTENEAVGAVISGFGNLDDLADELGLTEEVIEENNTERRKVSFEEASDYVAEKSKNGFLMSLGIMCAIFSIAAEIIGEEVLHLPEGFGIGAMLLLMLFGVALIVYSSLSMKKWSFISKRSCIVDLETTRTFARAKEEYSKTRVGLMTLGIVLCAACWVPAAMLDGLNLVFREASDLSGALLFVLAGVGVFFIVYSSMVNGAYDTILKLNDKKTVAGAYVATVEKESDEKYTSETGRLIMSVFWPTVTCIYFIYSFLTFRWATSWLIWPIASVVMPVLKSIFVKKR